MGICDGLIAYIGSVRPKQNKHIYITARQCMMKKIAAAVCSDVTYATK